MTKNAKKNDAKKRLFRHAQQFLYGSTLRRLFVLQTSVLVMCLLVFSCTQDNSPTTKEALQSDLSSGISAYEQGDYKTALKKLRPLAERGNASANLFLGFMYRDSKGVVQDYAEAMKRFRKATDLGLGCGANKLGEIYLFGTGSVVQDSVEAIKWFLKGAEQECHEAQVHLGDMYFEHDPVEAVKWYRKGAGHGSAEGQFHLGVAYGLGKGVDLDYAEAVKWYRKSAEQGYPGGQNNLGWMYAHGHGVEQDPVEAYMWYSLAAAQKSKVANTNRDAIAEKMTPSQIAEAQKRAGEWRSRID